MGDLAPVKPFEGKHGIYHLEWEKHSQCANRLTAQAGERNLKGLLLEKVVDTPSVSVIDIGTQGPIGMKGRANLNAAAQHGVDLWAGDNVTTRAWLELAAPVVLGTAGICTFLTVKQREKDAAAAGASPVPVSVVSRRKFLKRAALGALGLTAANIGLDVLAATSGVKEKNGRPATNAFRNFHGATFEHDVILLRNRLAAAKLGYVARYYRKRGGEKPNVGAIYGRGHAELGQLVEDAENEQWVAEHVRDNPEHGLLWQFHYDPTNVQWLIETHHLLGPRFLRKLQSAQSK